MVYKHTDKTVAEIGPELGADYLLEGSIQREGKAVHVSAQLIRVHDQTQLWAHPYDREFTGLLALQKEIGRAIATHIQVTLAPNYTNSNSQKYVPNAEAYELYPQGLSHLEKRTMDELARSVDCFRRSTEKDVSFALAYAGLASA